MRLALVLGDSLLCVLIVAFPLLSPPVAFGAETPKKVLIFSSEDTYLPAITILNQVIRSTLKNGSPVGVQFYNEAQDSYRIGNEKYEEELVRLLQRKYDGEHVDLVYVLSPPALKFLLKHRGELFSDTPVIFIVVDQSQVADLNLGPHVTGVSGKVELSPTLDIALALQPQTQRVVVVAGNASLDNALVEQAHREFRPYEGSVEFTYLTGLPIEELRKNLTALPDRSIVFYLSFLSDSAGRVFASPEALSLVARSSSAPIYGASQTYMGSGMVGGRLISFEALGTRAAETGLRILAGESPQNIPPQTVPSVTMFDWRELRWWGISEQKLPPESIVRFREPTFWEQYKWRIIGVLSLCIFEALLIVWLLVNRSRRRQAERENERLAQLAETERKRLDEVVSNVPGIVWETRFDADGKTRKAYFVSDYVEQMLGYSVDEWLSIPNFALTIMADEDRERVARVTEAILEGGKEGVLQFRWVTKEGRVLWVEAQMAAIRDDTGQPVGLRGVTMDITERKYAEEARHLTEERLTQAISVARFGVFEHDHLNGALHGSLLTREIHGWRNEEEPSLEGLFAQVHLADRDAFIAAVRGAHDPAGDGFFSHEYRIVLAGGEVRWLSARAQTFFEGEGVERRPVRTIGAELDITERKQAEEALGESEARYRNVVETQTELICRFLPDSTLTFVNDAYCRHFAKTRDQLLGTKFIQLIPEHSRDAALNHVASLIENPRAETYEHEVILPNGGRGWQQWIDHVVESSNGHGVELQGIGRDITERRRAEEALRVSESRFRTMADSAPLLIWMCGPDNLCTYVNQGWLEFTGRTIEQELGKGWAEGIFSEDYARCWDIFNSAFDRREPLNMEYRLRRADGVFRWVYVSAAPRFTSENEFLGYIGSCIDIADRREAEEALQKAHEEVSKLKNQLQAENIYLQEEIKLSHHVDEIVGRSNAIKYVLFKVEQVGHTDTTVLILGETGTGKELVARAIHSQSPRKDRPLVKVNCAALSASLIESELFGHERGAFTGALARKIGRFELADGATIFLDEIGELPLELQPKLLRVIQEGEFERLGSSRTIKVNVRIIGATNRNMKLEVEKGTFREDLWYRLNVFPITVPPLRQRKEDIPPMVEHFVGSLSKKLGKPITSISSATVQKLQDYSWPGNVRELANVIERAVVNTQGPVLHIADQFEQPRAEESSSSTKSLEEMEKEYITRILDQTAWRIEGPTGAARILGLNPSTLRTRMVKLGIQKSMRSFAGSSGVTN